MAITASALGPPLAQIVVPSRRIQSDIHLRTAGADLFTDVQHRCLVPLAFAYDDGAIDGEGIESTAHCVDCRLVRGLFVATPC